MIIVIEGADGAGKTTLAHALMEALPPGVGEYIHATRPDDQWSYATGLIDEAVAAHRRGKTVIMDRLWISDNIYSWINPHYSRSGIHVRRQESVLNRYGAFYIMCCPHPRQLITEYKQLSRTRTEMFGDKIEGMQLVMQRYYDLWHGGPVPQGFGDRPEQYTDQLSVLSPMKSRPLSYLYDRFTSSKPHNWAKMLLQFISMQVEPFLKADVASTFTRGDEWMNLSGSLLTARALFVNNMENDYLRPLWWPLYDRHKEGEFFSKSLHRVGIPEMDVAVMHAYTRNNLSTAPLEKAINWLMEHRPEVRIIALGQEATVPLDELDIHYTMIPRLSHRTKHFHTLLKQVVYGSVPSITRTNDFSPHHVGPSLEGEGVSTERA